MQGYGLYCFEEMVYSPEGSVLTRGPSTYKIPGVGDIPTEFNVALLKDSPNPRAIYSSKGVGEPPLFLSSSIFFAIKDAVKAARKENQQTSSFRFDAPATAAKIRISCGDEMVEKVIEV